jgi:hypothetical protein
VVHNQCHAWDYHQANAEQRTKQVWFNDFLSRLKSKSTELYNKEMKKLEKSIDFDEENFDIWKF